MQRAQEPLGVGAVLDDDDRRECRPSPAITAPVSLRDSPALVELRVSRASRVQGRQHRQQCRPEAAMTLQLGRHGGRHALGVEVEQGERRAVIDDIVVGAGDQVRPRRAVA